MSSSLLSFSFFLFLFFFESKSHAREKDCLNLFVYYFHSVKFMMNSFFLFFFLLKIHPSQTHDDDSDNFFTRV